MFLKDVNSPVLDQNLPFPKPVYWQINKIIAKNLGRWMSSNLKVTM